MTSDLYLCPSACTKPFSFYYKQAQVVRGTHKIAQAFIKCLLTPDGSSLDRVVYGTALPDLIGANVVDEQYVRAVIYSAVESALNQVSASAGVLPDDIALSDARVTEVSFSSDGSVSISIQLTTSDGSSIALKLPLQDVTRSSASAVRRPLGALLEGY